MATSREDKHLAIKAAYRALRSIGLDHIRLDGARASDVSPTQESFEHAVLIVRAVAAIHARRYGIGCIPKTASSAVAPRQRNSLSTRNSRASLLSLKASPNRVARRGACQAPFAALRECFEAHSGQRTSHTTA